MIDVRFLRVKHNTFLTTHGKFLYTKELICYISRMIEKVINKHSLRDNNAHLRDLEYWLKKSSEERVAAVDILRKQYFGHSKGLQRSVSVVQRKKDAAGLEALGLE